MSAREKKMMKLYFVNMPNCSVLITTNGKREEQEKWRFSRTRQPTDIVVLWDVTKFLNYVVIIIFLQKWCCLLTLVVRKHGCGVLVTLLMKTLHLGQKGHTWYQKNLPFVLRLQKLLLNSSQHLKVVAKERKIMIWRKLEEPKRRVQSLKVKIKMNKRISMKL